VLDWNAWWTNRYVREPLMRSKRNTSRCHQLKDSCSDTRSRWNQVLVFSTENRKCVSDFNFNVSRCIHGNIVYCVTEFTVDTWGWKMYSLAELGWNLGYFKRKACDCLQWTEVSEDRFQRQFWTLYIITLLNSVKVNNKKRKQSLYKPRQVLRATGSWDH